MHCPREAKHDSVRRQAWAILALVNLCILVGAQTSPRPSHSEEIVAVKASEEAFRKAQLTYDKESAGSILADEFVGTWNHGEQVTKKGETKHSSAKIRVVAANRSPPVFGRRNRKPTAVAIKIAATTGR